MFVLGLQGSPRKKGNTSYLLSAFIEEAQKLGARTQVIEAAHRNIIPCKEYTVCEKKGTCPIQDDMETEIYGLLREADVIVAATPVFFYNITAQLKALIDRCQMFWARKYLLKLKDPKSKTRRGFLLSVGATRGKNLFEAIELSIKYFFDALAAKYAGSLTYRGIEKKGDMAKNETMTQDIQDTVASVLKPFVGRKRILFACRENACRSQMASAFAQYLAGDRIEAASAGSKPATQVNPDMVAAMAEIGIDMAYGRTRPLDAAIETLKPEIIVTMGCGEECPYIPGVQKIDWEVPDPAGQSMSVMQSVRDEIKEKVVELIEKV